MNIPSPGTNFESFSAFVISFADKKENYLDIPTKIFTQIGENHSSSDQMKKTVDEIEKFTQTLARDLTFSIDKDTGRTIVKDLDLQTKEVIRQIPTEENILIARTLGKIQGSLFSDKA